MPPQAWPAFQALGAARRAAPTCEEGQRRFSHLSEPYQETLPEVCRCLADDAEARLHHLKGPTLQRQSGSTAPLAERALEEERCRTDVLLHLWDTASRVQLVLAVLMRVSERWGTKPYSEGEQHQMRALRQALSVDQQPEEPSLVTMASQPRRSAAAAR